MTRTRRNLALGAITAISVLLVAWAARSGLGITPDSVVYVSGATSLANEGRLLDVTGQPLTLFPPGLSVLLAPVAALGWQVTSGALLLALICAAALVLLTFALGRVVIGSDVQALAVAAIVGVAPATVETFSMLWTEPAFTVVAVAVLLVLARAVRAGRIGRGELAGLVGLVWAAIALRYVGLVLVPVAVVGVWMATASAPRRITRTAAVAGTCLVLPVLLVIRNLNEGAGALGARYPGTQTPMGAVQRTLDLWGAYVTQGDPGGLTTAAAALVVVLVVAGAVRVVRGKSAGTVVVAFLIVYWAAIWWSQATTRVDVISDRLGYPALPATVLLAWVGATASGAWIGRRANISVRTWSTVGAIAAVAVVAILGARSIGLSTTIGQAPRGYAAAAASPSQTALAVRELPPDQGVATTDPWLAWWLRQSGPAVPVPAVAPSWPIERTQADLELLRQAVADGSVQVVAYFDGADAVMTPAGLEENGFVLTPLADFGDGTLLGIAAAPDG